MIMDIEPVLSEFSVRSVWIFMQPVERQCGRGDDGEAAGPPDGAASVESGGAS